MSIVRWNLKEAGCGEPTNPRANLRSDGQKPYIRLYMRVSLPHKMKPDSYTESCAVDAADGWRERNMRYLGRSVRNTSRGGNRYCEITLNAQKSAEAIVAGSFFSVKG